MSRNEERISLKSGTIHDVPEKEQFYEKFVQNQDTQKSEPNSLTAEVVLPSKGQFYNVSHPLCGIETIEIKFITTKEEDILTNPFLLKKGTVFDKLLESVIVNHVPVDTLLTCDRQAILLKERIISYGEDYKVNLQCPACGKFKDQDVDLSELKEISRLSSVPVVHLGENLFESFLPISKKKVVLRLPTGKDENDIAQKNQKNVNEKSSNATDYYRTVIHSIDDSQDKISVYSFISNMSAMDGKFIKRIMKEITPGIDFSVILQCDHCDTESNISLPITGEFFFPTDR